MVEIVESLLDDRAISQHVQAFIKPPGPGAPVRNCPYCRTSIDQAATRCPHCTSQLTAAGA